MQCRELTIGRTFDHGDDVFDTLIAFCRAQHIRQGYIPMFLADSRGVEQFAVLASCRSPAAH